MKPTHLFILLPLLLASCSMQQEPPAVSHPVIEGWFDSDRWPIVVYTKSVIAESEGNISQNIIAFGKVAVSCQNSTHLLIGGQTDSYFPPYRYYSYDIPAIPGEDYTLNAQYPGMNCTATAKMPSPTPIDSISIRPIEGRDSLRSVTLHFTAPEDLPAYYYLRIAEVKRRALSHPAFNSTTTVFKPGSHVEIPVYHFKNRLSMEDYVPQPKIGDEFEVSLCRVEKDVWEFWRALDELNGMGTGMFVGGSQAPQGNIRGGYGIWSPQGTSRSIVQVN